MRVIIIEDELLAQANLEHLLMRINPAIHIEARLGSVKDALAWLASHDAPDIAFVDVQLSDDHSFEIFRRTDLSFPLVFTTAYDKYLLESFEFNSIDYLLKPISEEKLRRTLEKLERLRHHFARNVFPTPLEAPDPTETSTKSDQFPERIVARKGNQFVVVPIAQIAYFFTMHKISFLKEFTGREMTIDKNLSSLEETLDPSHFVRLNRKYIASSRAITRYTSVLGKIRVILNPEPGEEVFVSKESAPDFRQWIGQKNEPMGKLKKPSQYL